LFAAAVTPAAVARALITLTVTSGTAEQSRRLEKMLRVIRRKRLRYWPPAWPAIIHVLENGIDTALRRLANRP